VIVTFKKVEDAEWDSLPNERQPKGKKSKKGKAAGSPPSSPPLEAAQPPVEEGPSQAELKAEVAVREAEAACQNEAEAVEDVEDVAAAKAEEKKRKKKEKAKAKKKEKQQGAAPQQEPAPDTESLSKRGQVEAAVAEARKAREEAAGAVWGEAEREAMVANVEAKVAAVQSAAAPGISYSKWDNFVDSDDSDDDPAPPTQAGGPNPRRAPSVNGVSPPSQGSNPFEEEMLKDPRLLQAAKLIEKGRKNGDMDLLKQAEKLTHQALAAKGMRPDQIARMLGTAPVAAVPSSTQAPVKLPAYDIRKPADAAEMRGHFTSGLAELTAQQASIQAEEAKLAQLAEAGNPEEFFKYMHEQGMSEEDLTRLMSGDQSVMQEAVDRKTAQLDSDTKNTVDRVEQVAAQIDALSKGELDPQEIETQLKLAAARKSTPKTNPSSSFKFPVSNASPKGGRGKSVPVYTIEPVEGALRVVIELPGVTSVGEIDMEITRSNLELEVEGLYELKLRLPQPVDDDEVAAKFIKQESRLLLTLGLE